MKRFILTSVAAAFAAVLGTTNLYAAPHGGHPAHAAPHTHAAPHAQVAAHAHAAIVVHGHSMHVPIHVRGYRGWVSRCWFPRFGCYGYYCGTDQAWYYWYAPFDEYLPISYMSIYPPAPIGVAPTSVVPLTPGMPMSATLPPGATFVPGPITAP
jgi:hypothetical protein